jgi:hypothetical protein
VIEPVPGGTLKGLEYWWCYRRADVVYVEHYRSMEPLEAAQRAGLKVRGPYLAPDAKEARRKAMLKLKVRLATAVYTNPEPA